MSCLLTPTPLGKALLAQQPAGTAGLCGWPSSSCPACRRQASAPAAPAPCSLEEPLLQGRAKHMGRFNKILSALDCPSSVPLLHPHTGNFFFQYAHSVFLTHPPPFFLGGVSPPFPIFLFLLTVFWLFGVSGIRYEAYALSYLSVCKRYLHFAKA